jgi:hypothetical protein
MQVETIKALVTYVTALLLIIGGLLFLYFSRLDPPEAQTASLIPLIAGFVGAAIQFLFNRETQTQTARQVERSTATGAASSSTTTVNAAPPSNVTVNTDSTEVPTA